MNKQESKQRNNVNNKKNKKYKKIKKKHTLLKFFLSIILIGVLFMCGFVGYSTYKNGWGVKGLIQTAMGQDERKLADLDPFTVLILGVSEDISSKLTDTIMVASYNPKTQKATLISIPRDTFVGTNKNKATSYDKLNSLYQKSPAKTLEAVNKITGLNIVYYVVVNNNALVQLVDSMGGVEYDVPINMDYDDSSQDLHIHLKAGVQKLTGEQAEWLVRFRHNNNGTSYPSSYGNNDIGRMKTQREFLKVVAKQTIQLKNVTKIGSFIDIFKENVTTNISNWSMIKDYIPYALDFSAENIEAVSIPGTTGSYGTYNLSFFVHNDKETKTLVKELFDEQNYLEDNQNQNIEESKSISNNSDDNKVNTNIDIQEKENTSKIKIELLNGSGDSTLLTKATEKLKQSGYNIYKTGTTNLTSKTTIINKTSVSSTIIDKIKSVLNIGIISNANSGTSSVDITIILGKDYK